MICWICHKKVNKSLMYKNIGYGYCETHAPIVQLGVVKLVSTGKSDFLDKSVQDYVQSRKSSAEVEFEKQLDIEEFLDNDKTHSY